MTTSCHLSRHQPGDGRSCYLLAVATAGGLFSPAAFPGELQDTGNAPALMDELVVTARKIDESIHDVPVSVQVLTADLLDVVDTTHVLDLQHLVPGLVVNNLGLNGAGFSLRAVADQGGSSLSVATHMNGVYLGDSILPVARLFDLERIEILKGPQGTLYGRNATGGSINIIPRPPEHVFSADIEAARGSFDTTRIQGHVNVPFDASALRVAYIASEGDGFIRNSVDARRFAEQDFGGLRVMYRIEPSERLRVDLMAQHVTDDGAAGELWLPRPDFLSDRSDIRLATVTLADPFLHTDLDNANVNVEYDLGFATLHSISGYARSEVRDVDDCAGLPILSGCVRSVLPSNHEQLSQELRLASRGDGALDWLAGVYLYDGDKSWHFYQLTPIINPNPTINSYNTSSERTLAVFGQVIRRLGERWRMTGGLRLNREDHRLATIGTGSEDSHTGLTAADRWHNDSWRVDLQYAASDDVNAYAGVSTGFKSGGLSVLAGGVVDTFDPEHLTAYEVGIKVRRPDGRFRLHGAAFYYDFRDLQVYTSTITDSGLVFETDNAARAEIYGVDADAGLQLPGGLFLSAGVVWLPKREFVEYRNDRTGDTLSGNALARSPEWSTTSALDYQQPLARFGRFSARLEYNYRSAIFYTPDNEPQFAQDGFGLWNFFLRFEPVSDKWYVFASGRNLGNEDYFNQVFLQASPGYPDAYEGGFGYRF